MHRRDLYASLDQCVRVRDASLTGSDHWESSSGEKVRGDDKKREKKPTPLNCRKWKIKNAPMVHSVAQQQIVFYLFYQTVLQSYIRVNVPEEEQLQYSLLQTHFC